jgi:hypothetical protein
MIAMTYQPQPSAQSAPITVTVQPAGPGAFEVLPPPRSSQELNAIRQARSQLSDQLISASNRREEIARELRRPGVEGADRAGLEERLRLLDQRILRLEADIAATGRQLTTAPASLVAGARVQEAFGGLPPGGIIGGGIVFTLFVLAPIAFAAARLMWRRATRQAPAPARGWDNSPRFERLETAVDAIAVELERVSEGQRFVTKLLADSHGLAATPDASRAAEPLPAAPASARGPRHSHG